MNYKEFNNQFETFIKDIETSTPEELNEIEDMLTVELKKLENVKLNCDTYTYTENVKRWIRTKKHFLKNNQPITIQNNITIQTAAAPVAAKSGPRDYSIIPNFIFDTIFTLKEPIDNLDWNIIYAIGKRIYCIDKSAYPSLATIGKECGISAKSVENRLNKLESKKIFKINKGFFDKSAGTNKPNNYEWYSI